MKHICRIVLFLFLCAFPIISCEAKVPVSESYRLVKILFRYGDDALPVLNRLQKVIPEDKVDELAKIALEPGGMKKVNAYLGHLALPRKYPDG
ncbi:MAG: hypothetical protein J6A23_09420, partial [Thermoguttaceae bacterium]|nr:hypothetical protein [Thermoguttaceae bacterium]